MIMKRCLIALAVVCLTQAAAVVSFAQSRGGRVAVIYFWKVKPGKLQEYNRYIRQFAEPIDAEAKRQGAFISVTTLVSQRDDGPWTHMRIFIVRDRAQGERLAKALEAADIRTEPIEAKRKARTVYATTLRDLVAQEVVDIMK